LLGQGRAQIGVVVDDQDLKSRGHELVLDEAGFPAFNTRDSNWFLRARHGLS
jgi:hypothetical protein